MAQSNVKTILGSSPWRVLFGTDLRPKKGHLAKGEMAKPCPPWTLDPGPRTLSPWARLLANVAIAKAPTGKVEIATHTVPIP